MKHIWLGAVLGLGIAGAAMAADPLEGTWKTEVDDGSYAHIDIAPCGAALCGVIAKSFNASGAYRSENQGKTLVIDMVPQGDGHYAGKVWRPSNDKIYIGKMDLSGNTVALRGCVAGGLICSKQSWSRVN
ncbi:DUF2147 domain-containing protein [Antarcticimicrobium sediminis]|uniref:DUF2147 domain-containing protein n=1 Tax=Antarcticimicrobium sediminis TaxID=2546227 RepID=A0A4V2Z8Q0_9RHOB|nr:DUF2147 domain-containing protein [Antarcticimicrobium sediminis]TDE41186.1 DUF2147 domain-containing protein [Antarcticimicrobium sediminis]